MSENRQNLNDNLLKGAENLDITPSMFGEANTHYAAFGEFIQNNGIESDVSLYGSIATGTTVRPWTEDEDAYFDFDALCKLTKDRDKNASAAAIRENIESLLLDSDRYRERIDISDDCCITVNYAQNGKEGGFRLDLCACIDDESYADASSPLNESVQIAKKSDEWMGSNPIGLVHWFKETNASYSRHSSESQRRSLFENNRAVYASIEEVPYELERSALQRAIQILKRSRDVYYCQLGDEEAPTSCSLMVMVALIAKSLPETSLTIDILEAFCAAFPNIDAMPTNMSGFSVDANGKWALQNPVYGEDLFETWTITNQNVFLRWIEGLKREFGNFIKDSRLQRAAMESVFGKRQANILMPTAAVPVIISSAPHNGGHKPWKAM